MQQHGRKYFASLLFLAHLCLLFKANRCLNEFEFGPACTGGGGGGYSDIFVHIRRLGSFYLVQNFEFQYF